MAGQLQSVLLLGDQMTIAVAAIAGCRLILRIQNSKSTTPDTTSSDLDGINTISEWRVADGEMLA